ncbi:mitochondrial 54S ribosomal protein bL17m Ecym_6284 [Eremothecium cymbalariae DBVPG|uniref:Large ribosomal subunit protein bL17m C-terminal fungi domain-containing protein n=1 Tax=Eremothecium cymbalariae (strain CBS 270.75 / DBVPG 7215 / KCTC 17166 / NRRL Y-17582) TaxID=931890 RepID=G8JVI5_ERECY|nr:hypothetical protein Ecym_6284 [Eremothecium cymbalariae DBVPG\
MTVGLRRQLSRTKPHREALMRSLASQLLQHEVIVSTTPKLKEAQRHAERIITIAKKAVQNPSKHIPELQSRLYLSGDNSKLLKKLLEDIAPRYSTRERGYTRLMKLEPRLGDRAPSSVLELVDAPVVDSDGNLLKGNMKLWLIVKAILHANSKNEELHQMTLKNLHKLSKGMDRDAFLRDVRVVREFILKKQGVEVNHEETDQFLQYIDTVIKDYSVREHVPLAPKKVGYQFMKDRPYANKQ